MGNHDPSRPRLPKKRHKILRSVSLDQISGINTDIDLGIDLSRIGGAELIAASVLINPARVGPTTLALATAAAPTEPFLTGSLELVVPLLWSDEYSLLLATEARQLEKHGLLTAARELQALVPVNSYVRRNLHDEDRLSHKQDMLICNVAAGVQRASNQKIHVFSVIARSVSALMRRVPSADWKRGVRLGELVSKPTAIKVAHLMQLCRPPPAFEVSMFVQHFVSDQKYGKKGKPRGTTTNYTFLHLYVVTLTQALSLVYTHPALTQLTFTLTKASRKFQKMIHFTLCTLFK